MPSPVAGLEAGADGGFALGICDAEGAFAGGAGPVLAVAADVVAVEDEAVDGGGVGARRLGRPACRRTWLIR
jgi:hypothetical protein